MCLVPEEPTAYGRISGSAYVSTISHNLYYVKLSVHYLKRHFELSIKDPASLFVGIYARSNEQLKRELLKTSYSGALRRCLSSQYLGIAAGSALHCIPIKRFLEVPKSEHAVLVRLLGQKDLERRMDSACSMELESRLLSAQF